MKNFWKKYRALFIVLVVVASFVSLSFIGESAGKVEDQNTVISSDVSSWKTEVESDKNVITVIALSYCEHCKNYKPIITAIAGEYNIPIYWFEIDTMESADSKTLTESYDFSEYTGSSPYTAITNASSVLAQKVGYMDKDTTLEFLRTNGIIK